MELITRITPGILILTHVFNTRSPPGPWLGSAHNIEKSHSIEWDWVHGCYKMNRSMIIIKSRTILAHQAGRTDQYIIIIKSRTKRAHKGDRCNKVEDIAATLTVSAPLKRKTPIGKHPSKREVKGDLVEGPEILIITKRHIRPTPKMNPINQIRYRFAYRPRNPQI